VNSKHGNVVYKTADFPARKWESPASGDPGPDSTS
jgi:hypothetical protein